VTKIDSRGNQSRIITGLPSFAGEKTGAAAIGPSDVIAVGRSISVLIGLGADPKSRAALPAPGQQMGTLIQTTKTSARPAGGTDRDQGVASIFRVDRRGNVTTYATGLTNVTDLAFRGKDLYAVQISTDGLQTGRVQGSVVKVKRNGKVPADHTVIAGDLFAPYGIAIKNNYAYVTTGAVAPGAGRVITIQL